MKIIIDLELIKSLNLTPNQYVTLYLLFYNIEHDFDNTANIKQLQEKNWLDSNCNIVHVFRDQLFSSKVDWIQEWVDLFPTMGTTGLTYHISANTKECEKRMFSFLLNYPSFNKEVIFQATSNYLNRQEHNGWKYTKKNYKFVQDKEGSVLEKECFMVLKGEKEMFKDYGEDI